MPELPEVETIVRGLGPKLERRRIEAIWWSGRPLHLGRAVDLEGLRTVALGRVVSAVRRRGKYVVIELAGWTGDGVVIHLGMTGRLRVQPASAERAPHTHLVFDLGANEELRFVDARRFGWVAPGRPLAEVAALRRLGPDPFTELEAPALGEALATSRAPIKSFLLDQHRVAGLGNIYASEALFLAGVHPTTPASRLRRRAPELLGAMRAALAGGIARRGTTLRDYVDADGLSGDNAAALLVYGRRAAPCPRCATPIRRRVDAGRATFYCPRCQRR